MTGFRYARPSLLNPPESVSIRSSLATQPSRVGFDTLVPRYSTLPSRFRYARPSLLNPQNSRRLQPELRHRNRLNAERSERRRAAIMRGQHPDAVGVHGDRVLPVRRGTSVLRRDGPAVFAHEGLDASERHHGFDCDDQAGLHRWAPVSHPIVEHRRLLVHRAADAVAHVVLEDAVRALSLDVLLDRAADLAEVAGPRQRGDAVPERLLGDIR